MPLGIPDRSIKTRPRELEHPEVWNFNVQKHDAKRAGTHYDLRLVDPQTGIAHSWAARNLPKMSGDRVLAVHQPNHTAEYSTWSGNIPEGYGAGNVSLFSSDKVEVTKSAPDHITFNVYKSTGDTEHYTLIHTGGDDWLFTNSTPTKTTRPEIDISKPKFKSISPGAINTEDASQILAAKIDGAMNAFLLRKNRPIEVYSYRPSKKGKAKLIEHTFRTNLYKVKTPEHMKGSTVLLGEIFAKDTKSGKALSNRDTSSRLLSNVWKSRELQRQAPLSNIVFDVVRHENKDVSNLPYAEKLHILQNITRDVPELKMPELATTSQEKRKLLKSISSGKHPLTSEGVVVYNLGKPVPEKAKLFHDFDVRIHDIFPGEGKYKGTGAGGFTYSHVGNNTVVGRVGSGFNDQLRREMFATPEQFRGAVVRVLAQEKLPSGALRMPVYKDIRSESWPRMKKHAAIIEKKITDPAVLRKKDFSTVVPVEPDLKVHANEAHGPVLGDSMDNVPVWNKLAKEVGVRVKGPVQNIGAPTTLASDPTKQNKANTIMTKLIR